MGSPSEAAPGPTGPASPKPDSPVRLEVQLDPAAPDFGSVAVLGLASADVGADELRRLAPGDEPPLAVGRRVLAVRLDAASGETARTAPPLLGTWTLDGNVLRFHPRFLPEPGLPLVARFDGPGLVRALADGDSDSQGATPLELPVLELAFALPAPPESEPTRVVGVVPDLPEVPENLLRFYVRFSGPMGQHDDVAAHVALLDASGEPIPEAFVELPEGLWDPGRRRLTLIVHPGRVKRGVGPRLALGPVLEEGATVRLRVDSGLRDAAGRPLAADFEREIHVGPADRDPPDPARWTVLPPRTPTSPLVVEIPEPLDPEVLRRALLVCRRDGRVETPDGTSDRDRPASTPDGALRSRCAPEAGAVEVAADGRRWAWTPTEPWNAGASVLRVEPFLEDLAGNRVGVPFDRATPGGAPEGAVEVRESEGVEVPFEVRWGAGVDPQE